MPIKSAEEIKESLAVGFVNAGVTNFNDGSVADEIVDNQGDVVSAIYDFGIDVQTNGYAATATGAFLEAICAERGLSRLPGAKARRKVVLSRNKTSSTVFIPEGTIIQSRQDSDGSRYRFLAIQDYTLAVGESEIEIVVEAEAEGEAYNLPAGTVDQQGTLLSGIDEIDDTSLSQAERIVSEGADEESDTRLRRRYFLAWDEQTTGSTAAAYLSWVMADIRVAQSWIDFNGPRGEGTITIYVLSTVGAPSKELLTDLREEIIGTPAEDYQDGKRAAGDDVWIQGPSEETVDITATVQYYSSYDRDDLDDEIRAVLAAYFNPSGSEMYSWLRPLGVGKQVVLAQLIECITRPDAVYDVSISAPTANVAMNADQLPILGTVTITYVEVTA
jgi:uncharacterized phage protein gp47/JayE